MCENLFTVIAGTQQTMSLKELSITTFHSYMGVYCEYVPDGTGRVHLNLVGSNEDEEVVFHHDARANWGGEENSLVLNTKVSGEWKNETRPSGFPFTPNVNVAVTAVSDLPNKIYAYANGNQITEYSIQGGATVSDIKGIEFESQENDHPQLGVVAIGRVSEQVHVCCTCRAF